MRLPPAILVMGPTASGKTAVAMELADRFPVELISVDSAQIFRDMNVGTAKPDPVTLARYPHRLIDIITPDHTYSAARFRQDALQAMSEISASGRIPLLVGGTMLYFKALMQGLADLPSASPDLRAAIDQEAQERGWTALHAELMRDDPVTAARLHPGDSQRLQRAIEVFRLTGRPLSDFLAASTTERPPYDFLTIGLLPSDRSILHERIANRFDGMLAHGLVDEVLALRRQYVLNPDLPSMRCVGYRQTWEMLDDLFSLRELRDRGIFATRQLAKRQITWLSNSLQCEQFDCLDPQLARLVEKRVARHLAE